MKSKPIPSKEDFLKDATKWNDGIEVFTNYINKQNHETKKFKKAKHGNN